MGKFGFFKKVNKLKEIKKNCQMTYLCRLQQELEK